MILKNDYVTFIWINGDFSQFFKCLFSQSFFIFFLMFSSETREEAICRLHILGHSIAAIRKATGIRYERVIKTINFYEQNRVLPPSAKNGRPKKISNDALNRITVLTLQDRGIPYRLISKKLQDEGFNGLSTTTVWSFPQESIDRLILSFPGRLGLVINKEGASISDELRTSLTKILSFSMTHTEEVQLDKVLTFKDQTIDDNLLEYRTRRPWTPEEDKMLIEKVQIFGTKWVTIVKFFDDRNALSLKLRYRYLYK